jgi:gliding motility-associated-like protein
VEPKENIEELFKNAFEHHKEQVSPDLWGKISGKISTPPSDGTPPDSGASSAGAGNTGNLLSGAKGLGLGVWGGAAIVAVTAGVIYLSSPFEKTAQPEPEAITQTTLPEEVGQIESSEQQNEIPVLVQEEVSATAATPHTDINRGNEQSVVNNNSTENNDRVNKVTEEPAKSNNTEATNQAAGAFSGTTSVDAKSTTPQNPVDNVNSDTSPSTGNTNTDTPVNNNEDTNTSFNLTAMPKNGVAPLNVKLSLPEFYGDVTWEFGDGASGFGGKDINHQYEFPGTYTAWARFTDSKGNSHAEPVIVIVETDEFLKEFIPNVFTPNGDGVNDRFTIKSVQLNTVDVTIYDRRGRQVFQFTNPDIGWDGTINSGTPAPEGNYLYILKAKDNDGRTHNYKGTLKLIR